MGVAPQTGAPAGLFLGLPEEGEIFDLLAEGHSASMIREDLGEVAGRMLHHVSATYRDGVDLASRLRELESRGFTCEPDTTECRSDEGRRVWASPELGGIVTEITNPEAAYEALFERADPYGFPALRPLHEALGGIERVDLAVREVTHHPGESKSTLVAVRYDIETASAENAVRAWLAGHDEELNGVRAQFELDGRSVGVELLDHEVVLFSLQYPIGTAAPEASPNLDRHYLDANGDPIPPEETLDELENFQDDQEALDHDLDALDAS